MLSESCSALETEAKKDSVSLRRPTPDNQRSEVGRSSVGRIAIDEADVVDSREEPGNFSITDAVEVAIHTVGDVIHTVVETIEDAIATVVSFLEKLTLKLWEVIQFLMAMFDWGAIPRTHRVIRDVALASVDVVSGALAPPAGLTLPAAPAAAPAGPTTNLTDLARTSTADSAGGGAVGPEDGAGVAGGLYQAVHEVGFEAADPGGGGTPATYLITHELQGTSLSYGVFGIVLGLLAWNYLSTLMILLAPPYGSSTGHHAASSASPSRPTPQRP
jgi:hypothetical protein